MRTELTLTYCFLPARLVYILNGVTATASRDSETESNSYHASKGEFSESNSLVPNITFFFPYI